MERLKAILADKILDLSAGNGDEVKAKIDKIHRFRDFANACKTLMIKYPAIEDELINMVEGGDFDTKVASSRVDTVIRLADKATQSPIPTPQIEENEESDNLDLDMDDIPMEVYQGEEEPVYQPEDIDYEELESSTTGNGKDDYVTFEDFSENAEPDTITEQILESETQKESNYSLSDDESAAKRKLTIRRVTQGVGAILVIVALVFIVKFVMVHWQTILIIAGALLVLVILFFWFKRKRS
ncbi:MAG: LPXTG cell wall anchor domain-containing protein [Prevotella sp.]|jgi:LPXTG-motif cell wall-anchored protein|nr:LPXTG cell wall anchor domain-containing protein [Prevotella sp.]